MATAGTRSFPVSIAGRLGCGIVGGLAGGVVFGILMQATGAIGMVAQLIGSESVVMGWLVHLFNSALFGAIFALLFSRWAGPLVPATLIGLAYGLAWWVLGALLIMPAWLGMNEMIFELTTTAWQSLAGHLLYGLLLGVVFALLSRSKKES